MGIIVTIAQDFLYGVTALTLVMVLTSLPRPWSRSRRRQAQ
jgi:hypothetical protein